MLALSPSRKLYSFYIDLAQLDALRARTAETGESVSDQIRTALDRALAKRPAVKKRKPPRKVRG